MATETLTAPAPVAHPKRRHSAEASSSHSYATIEPDRRRGNSVNVASVARQNKRTLPPVPEDEQLKAEAVKRRVQPLRRLSRAFSWSTNWTFAGESTKNIAFTGDQASLNEERRFSRLSRRLSSISSAASSVAEFVATEPSHETNFPKGLTFPNEGGFRVRVRVYGTVDALEATTMRLLMPRGVKYANFTGSEDYVSALEHICKLKNGDMLCKPPPDVEKGQAVILRGTVQDFVFKCFVVGTFPMELIMKEETLPETYEMGAVIY